MNEYLGRLAGTLASNFRINSVRLKDAGGKLAVRNVGDTANAALEASVLKLTGGTPASGKVLVSDADGNGSWEDISGAAITVRDIDGTPSISASTIEFTNGAVQDQGGGVARVTVGSGPSVRVWMADAPPESPSEWDDEFQDTTLSADWTVTPGSTTYTVGQDSHPGLWIKANGQVFYMSKTMPDVKYSAWAKFGVTVNFAAHNTWIGIRKLGTSDSAAKNYYSGFSAGTTSWTHVIQRQNYLNSYESNVVARSLTNSTSQPQICTMYVRWIYDPSTKELSMLSSDDGIGWRYDFNVTTPTVLDGMQFMAASPIAAHLQFFRVSTTLTNRDDPMPGRHIYLPTS